MELEPLEAREAFNDSQKEIKLKEVNKNYSKYLTITKNEVHTKFRAIVRLPLDEYKVNDNEMLNKEDFESMARQVAVKACNDIDPGVPLSYTNGKPLTEDEVFAHSKANPDDVYFGKIQYQVYDKLQNLYDVYNALMDSISYYN